MGVDVIDVLRVQGSVLEGHAHAQICPRTVFRWGGNVVGIASHRRAN